MHILTITLPQAAKKATTVNQIIHQQSIINQRHTAGPDRVTQYQTQPSWRAGKLKSCITSSLLSRRTDPCLSVSLVSLSVLVDHPRSSPSPLHHADLLHCRRIPSCPSKTPSLPPRLLCQRQMATPKSDPIGLTAIWSSLLLSSDGQHSSRVHSAQKHIRSRQRLACHARTFAYLPNLLSSPRTTVMPLKKRKLRRRL